VNSGFENFAKESLRLDPPFRGVFRVASTDTASAKKGTELFLDLATACQDPKIYPNPDSFEPTRPNTHHLFTDDGIYRCLGEKLTEQIMGQVLKAIFSLKNIERGPEQSGKLKRFKDHTRPELNWAYLNDAKKVSAWPTSLHVLAMLAEQPLKERVLSKGASRPDSEEESEQKKINCSTLLHTYNVTDNKHVHLTTNGEWSSCDQNQCPNALANLISEPYNLTDIDGSVLKFDRFIPVLPPLPLSPTPVRPVTPSLSRTPGHSRPGSRIGRHSRPTSRILPAASPAPALLSTPRGPSVPPFIPVTTPRTPSPELQPPAPPIIMNNEQLAHLLEGLNTVTNALLMQTTCSKDVISKPEAFKGEKGHNAR
ncbi:hypothetical protein L218DRAFT_1003293, partial [Marasmius fiardii PR-910]